MHHERLNPLRAMNRRLAWGTLLLLAVGPLACNGASGARPGSHRAAVPGGDRHPAEEPTDAGLRSFVEAAIRQANAQAAALDGKTFVQRLDVERAVYFVPVPQGEAPKPPPPPKVVRKGPFTVVVVSPPPPPRPIIIPDTSITSKPPENARRQTWTDRYALAQQYTYQYSLVDCKLAGKDEHNRQTAQVTLKLTVKRRVGMAKAESKIPRAPDGTRLWLPAPSWFGYAPGRWAVRQLPGIIVPGTHTEQGKVPLVVEALREMVAKEPEAVERTVKVEAIHWSAARNPVWYLFCPGGSDILPEDARPTVLTSDIVPRGQAVVILSTTRPAAAAEKAEEQPPSECP